MQFYESLLFLRQWCQNSQQAKQVNDWKNEHTFLNFLSVSRLLSSSLNEWKYRFILFNWLLHTLILRQWTLNKSVLLHIIINSYDVYCWLNGSTVFKQYHLRRGGGGGWEFNVFWYEECKTWACRNLSSFQLFMYLSIYTSINLWIYPYLYNFLYIYQSIFNMSMYLFVNFPIYQHVSIYLSIYLCTSTYA